ncbi:unnamed protein product [Didymodactylos carnosus]|uniref:Aminoglycoside phosphotransferase domain-containing protein n=1 Tax=Didymodactylos carnosus TaxID=1234261 RepID=A0A814JCV7_9BILA|nr:unnamed protein product [Didymodactylos carnosus]CAF1140487.1 unnamed protein product [Didymodactylos carnosus]CAF3804876.1 unnamed protein product [Didymodactylos carnosus]CAF3934973.1 unnamed protein product [Didymodactylos carnosus]
METDDNNSDIRHLLLTYWPHIFQSSSNDLLISLISQPGSVNTNWRICLPSTTTSYVLKRLKHEQNPQYELNYLIDFQKYLDTSFQVPQPVPLSSSQAIFIEYNNHFYWLYEHINGIIHKTDFNEKQLLSLATCLSKYHRFLITHDPPLHKTEQSHRRQELLDELVTSVKMITSEKQQQSETLEIDLVEDYIFDCYPQLSKLIKESLRKHQTVTTTNRSYPIHRDIRPGNVVWNDNNNVVGLLDFENVDANVCNTLWSDLAICLLTFCCSDDDQSQSDMIKIQILLDEYLKQVFNGLSIPTSTKHEFINLILDEMILCSIEDYLFLYWQYRNEREKFQGLNEMKLYYKRSIWHYENKSKFY